MEIILDNIESPAQIRGLKIEELEQLCCQLRQRIIEVTLRNGGHLASSLGAVELIVALHYCLDTPRDKIIFDVGHQAYAHKLLTGRNRVFDSLRQYGGISGFPYPKESVYDVFASGHSSDAISLALGIVCARDMLPASMAGFKVVAVIGDGSLSGGLCFEGLNNAGHLKKDLLVVLNTNELSISPNVGALSTYINKIISLPVYNRFRQSLEAFVKTRLPKGSRILKLVSQFEEALKGLFIPGVFFEEMGFRYFGPIDGHNLHLLIPTLRNILSLGGPRIFHVVTRKGKGYPQAESQPVKYHGVSPAYKISAYTEDRPTYTEVFKQRLIELAAQNKKIVAITAAMPEGTGLDAFMQIYPERFFDVGIAEAHAVCFAAGLAKAGLKPVVAIYSTFLQRAYDQIIENVCLQELPVVFCVDRAGIVGEDGLTHQGLFDISYLRCIPNLVVMAPKDGEELAKMLEFAFSLERPVAIRYPRGLSPYLGKIPCSPLVLGEPEVLFDEGNDFAIFALGSMVEVAVGVIDLLRKRAKYGKLVNARFIKPLCAKRIKEICGQVKFVFSVEEGVLNGGFGSAIMEIAERPLVRIGLPDEFIPHGSRGVLLERYGLTKEMVFERIMAVINSEGNRYG